MIKKSKKYILAIETTGKICGVALSDGKKLLSENNIDSGQTHSVTLFTNIDNILKKNNIKASDISKICVSAGPGSFTGIRIGIATALGIAKPYNTIISYIDTLDSIAYNVKNTCDIIISIMDARANRVFISVYNSKNMKKYLNDSIYDIDSVIDNLNNYFENKNIRFIFVGDGVHSYNEKLKNNLKIKYDIAQNSDCVQKASSLIYVNGKVSKKVSINYLLKSKAEREKNA